MSIQIAEVLHTHQDDVQKLMLPVAMGDEAGFLNAMEGLLTKVAQGIPWVGPLAGEGVKKAFASSAYRQMDSALAELKQEQDQEAKWDRLRALIEVMIGQALGVLIKHLRPGHQEIERQLGLLDERLSDFRRDFEAKMQASGGFNVVVDDQHVLDGAIGVQISPETLNRAHIRKQRVEGKGSIGIKL
jgi:hypothetical protein